MEPTVLAASMADIKLNVARLYATVATADHVLRDVRVLWSRLTSDYTGIRAFLDRVRAACIASRPDIAARPMGKKTWPSMDATIDRIWEVAAAKEPVVDDCPAWLSMENAYLVKPRGSLDSPIFVRSTYVQRPLKSE